MNKETDRRIVKNLLAKGTDHKAPHDMSDRVWSALNIQENKVQVYRPLIPSWIWIMIGVVVFGVLILASTSPSTSSGRLNWQEYLQPLAGYLDQSLYNISLIAFSSLMVLVIILLFNSLLIQTRYKKLYY